MKNKKEGNFNHGEWESNFKVYKAFVKKHKRFPKTGECFGKTGSDLKAWAYRTTDDITISNILRFGTSDKASKIYLERREKMLSFQEEARQLIASISPSPEITSTTTTNWMTVPMIDVSTMTDTIMTATRKLLIRNGYENTHSFKGIRQQDLSKLNGMGARGMRETIATLKKYNVIIPV